MDAYTHTHTYSVEHPVAKSKHFRRYARERGDVGTVLPYSTVAANRSSLPLFCLHDLGVQFIRSLKVLEARLQLAECRIMQARVGG
jgi:hypothetical protein